MKQYDEVVAITTQLIHNKFSSTKLLQLRARAFYYLVRPSGDQRLSLCTTLLCLPCPPPLACRGMCFQCIGAPGSRLGVEATPSASPLHRVTGLCVLEGVSLMYCAAYH